MLELEISSSISVRNATFRSADNSVQYYTESTARMGFGSSTLSRWNGPNRKLVATIDWMRILQMPKISFAHLDVDGKEFLRRTKLRHLK